jgi:hypothetical protein
MPYPHGITDIAAELMIDLDECGIYVDDCSRRHGKAPPSIRVGEAGQYSREGEKCNLLLAICGDQGTVQQPSHRWQNIWLEGGTTVERMIAFVQDEILNSLGPGVPGRRYCITMDNLAAHKNLALQAMIVAAGHLCNRWSH